MRTQPNPFPQRKVAAGGKAGPYRARRRHAIDDGALGWAHNWTHDDADAFQIWRHVRSVSRRHVRCVSRDESH